MEWSVRRIRVPGAVASVLLASVLVGAFVSAPNAAASSHASEVAVTGHGVATAYNKITVLAGSATEAVYSVTRAQVGIASSRYGSGKSRPVLTARSRTGKTVRLGSMSDRVQNDEWSTVGHWVVAWSSSRVALHTRTIDVWNIATRHHRVVRLAKAATTAQATPKGFAYTLGSSIHEWVADSNSYRAWGTPFPKQHVAWFATDDRGLLVTGTKSGAEWMSYSHPGSYRKLKVGPGSYSCYAVNHAGAACEITAHGPSNVVYLPLDGGAAIRTSHPGVMLDDIALSGREVLYTGEVTDDVPSLYGFSAAHPTPAKWDAPVNYNMTSAYGKGLLMRADNPSKVLAVTSPDHIATAFAVARSADAAGAFALTSGRVGYVSDRRNSNDPTQTLSVRSASVRAAGGHVTVGASHQIAGRDGDLQVATFAGYPRDLAVTATATAFMRASDCCTWHAYVTTPLGTDELPGTFDPNSDYLEAAGHRVLAANPFSATGPIEIYDTNTGDVQDLSSLLTAHPVTFALTPSSLVYGTSTGVVRRLDLTTDLTRTIFTPARHGGDQRTDVFATDKWVAWNVSSVAGSKVVHTGGMRKVGTALGPVVQLPHIVYGISDSGVLIFGSDGPYQNRTWLRPFGAGLRTLLSPREYEQRPQLAGHVLAWVDGGGDLKVERYAARPAT